MMIAKVRIQISKKEKNKLVVKSEIIQIGEAKRLR